MTLPVAILAGGLATRLRPFTDTIPKALIDIAGEPFAFHQLRLLAANGIRDVVFCLGYRGEQVVERVGDGKAFGVSVNYVFDGPVLLGTGGAIVKALPLLGDDFLVLYGDSYLPCDYRAVEAAYRVSGKPALMTIFRNDGQWDASNVEYSAGQIIAYSKSDRTANMRHIDYGLGVFSRRAFKNIPPSIAFDLADIYTKFARRGMLAAYEVAERFYEIGSFAGIEELTGLLRGR